jgi:hypothetical protein
MKYLTLGIILGTTGLLVTACISSSTSLKKVERDSDVRDETGGSGNNANKEDYSNQEYDGGMCVGCNDVVHDPF